MKLIQVKNYNKTLKNFTSLGLIKSVQARDIDNTNYKISNKGQGRLLLKHEQKGYAKLTSKVNLTCKQSNK